MNSRNLTRNILLSVAVGLLGFVFTIQNREVVEIAAWVVGAFILGFLGGRGKWAASGIRYESKSKLFGLPIVSIASGPHLETNQDRGLAKGVIAIGDISFGVLSFGGIAFGVFSAGGASFGLVSVGGLSIGILALGGAAVGLLAAVGGVAIGYNVVGEVGIGIQHFEDAQVYILDLLSL
jgi:hypothetical protein